MQSENNVQLKLDISEVIDHANSIENPCEKLRYLRQYIPLLSVYAEHEPFQVEELIAEIPEKFREEVWGIYANKLELEGSKSESNTSVEQKIDININTEFIAQRVKPKVPRKTMRDPSHQMKKLINKVDIELEKRSGEPVSQREVWYELRVNHRNYDEEEIIDVAEPEKIIWSIYRKQKRNEIFNLQKKPQQYSNKTEKPKKIKLPLPR